jgi:hypothetical protein
MSEAAPLGAGDWQGWQAFEAQVGLSEMGGWRYGRGDGEALARDCKTVRRAAAQMVGMGRADATVKACEWDGAVVRVVANACTLAESGLLENLTYTGFPTWRDLAAALEARRAGEWSFSQDDLVKLCADLVAVEASCDDALKSGRSERPADPWVLLALAVHAVAIVKAGAARAVATGAMRCE